MRSVIRAAILLSVFLAIPIIPFLILGETFETQVTSWMQEQHELQLAIVAGLLVSDIFLPIPSSAVITYAGGVLGLWAATLTSWFGLTFGACLGFGLAKLLGKPFARRFAEAEDLQRVERVTERYGPAVLLLTRPLPILAEACVLLMGTTELSWKRFLLPVVVANFGISLVYALCGVGFQEQKTLIIVAVTSGTLPLLLALMIRRWLPTLSAADDEDTQ
jgi:uncharacterized membrane protein YdjX (TVP38/TMEM64 family)